MGTEASVIKITFLMYFSFLQYFMMRSRPSTRADIAIIKGVVLDPFTITFVRRVRDEKFLQGADLRHKDSILLVYISEAGYTVELEAGP